MFNKSYVHSYYTSPFCRYNGHFKNYNAIELACDTSKSWFESSGLDPQSIDYVIYGNSVHQKHGFYAGPWSASLLGTSSVGVCISQACTTGATSLYEAAASIEIGLNNYVYCLTADRTSSGPIITWEDNNDNENWIKDNFNYDPFGKTSMLTTAENVSKKYNISKEQIDDVAATRHEQYTSITNKPWIFPTAGISEDVGVRKVSKERLSRIKSVNQGTHSLGSITYPADGHCGILVSNTKSNVKIVSYGYARTSTSYMPEASIDACNHALQLAERKINDMKVINQHNAFAVNDIVLAQQLGINVDNINNYGSPLVYGHPQSPVLSRLIIEGIEEAKQKGGGYVLVCGAAGGDVGAAVILKVE